MDIESVKTLFRLFSGEESGGEYAPVIELAMKETEKILRPEADKGDIRLSFLAAAMANYRVVQLRSTQDRSRYTYAGKMQAVGKNMGTAEAEKQLRDYYELCSDLIVPQTFIFMGIGKGGERKC